MSTFDDFLSYAVNDTVNNGDTATCECGYPLVRSESSPVYALVCSRDDCDVPR